MLVLSRKHRETVTITVTEPCEITVQICNIGEARVRLGITAPKQAANVVRGELSRPDALDAQQAQLVPIGG